ncbi:hypothetical protein B0T22DRAFT_494714 [Podospora appendiculata]|uniref:Ankyrin repeat domain-containing protein n=1 Tax=Podospora appendiculata TaxID=314037 RepID=A0AAE1C7N9_9PEZI|nr:hypothetical protein B0T22DRAFT_494714 [Podospora appendiculata]
MSSLRARMGRLRPWPLPTIGRLRPRNTARPTRAERAEQSAARRQLVRLLVQAEAADLGPIGRRGETPLHQAARSWNAPLIKTLLALGADPHAADRQGITPLLDALQQDGDLHPCRPQRLLRRRKAAQLLLQAGGPPAAQTMDMSGNTPLHYLCRPLAGNPAREFDLELARQLLDLGAPINM